MKTIECSECEGRGFVVRELPDHTMNSGGFSFYEVECEECHGEGQRLDELNSENELEDA